MYHRNNNYKVILDGGLSCICAICRHTLTFLLHVCLCRSVPQEEVRQEGTFVSDSVSMCVSVSVTCALTCLCVCVSAVDAAGVGLAEGGCAALWSGTLGADPRSLPLQGTHGLQPQGPLEDHGQAQDGVRVARVLLTSIIFKRDFIPMFRNCFKTPCVRGFCFLLNVCYVRAVLLSSFNTIKTRSVSFYFSHMWPS